MTTPGAVEAEDPQVTRARERIGMVLQDKWTVESLLGVGGMAAVYAAKHRNGKRVAVKMLHAEFTHEGEVKQRFLQEGYAANTIQHEGAVSVLDDDVAPDGSAFIVMELLEGETVEQRWERKGQRLPPAEVLAIVEQLLDVLAAAHGKNVVHRDVKPENLFITKAGAAQGARLRHRARVRGAARAGDGDEGGRRHGHAGVHGARAGTRALGRGRRADGSLGRRRDDVHAAQRAARARGRERQRAAHPERDHAGAVARAASTPGVPPVVVSIVDRALAFDRTQPLARRGVDAAGRERGARRARRGRGGWRPRGASRDLDVLSGGGPTRRARAPWPTRRR